jgi:hypothetical protein
MELLSETELPALLMEIRPPTFVRRPRPPIKQPNSGLGLGAPLVSFTVALALMSGATAQR